MGLNGTVTKRKQTCIEKTFLNVGTMKIAMMLSPQYIYASCISL